MEVVTVANWVIVVNIFTAVVISINAWFDVRRYRRMAERELVMIRRVFQLEMMVHTLEARLTKTEAKTQ